MTTLLNRGAYIRLDMGMDTANRNSERVNAHLRVITAESLFARFTQVAAATDGLASVAARVGVVLIIWRR